jgi:hypothetical protein
MTEHDPIREWHAQKERAELVLDICAKVHSGKVEPAVAALALLTAGVSDCLIPTAIGACYAQPERLRLDPRTAIGLDLDVLASRAGVPPRAPGEPDADLRGRLLADDRVRGRSFPAEPVLPPGCRLVDLGSQGWCVRNLDPGEQAGWGQTPAEAAEAAWISFGAFMSRKDYEALSAESRYFTILLDTAERDMNHMRGEVARLRGELRRLADEMHAAARASAPNAT